MTPEQISLCKSHGFTHIYRVGSEFWGVKLIQGRPVWHRLPESQ